MGLLNFFARKKAVSASPEILEAAADRRISFYPLIATPPGAFGRIRDAWVETQDASYGWIYQHQPAVRTVVDYLAREIASTSLKLYERVGDDDRRLAGDHPAAVSLRDPNARQRTRAWLNQLAVQFLCYDNAYALKLRRDPDPTRKLVVVPSHAVGLLGPGEYLADGYRIWLRDGAYFDRGPEDVLHWSGTDPEDPRRGISRLETLRAILAEDRAIQTATVELAKAGGIQAGYLKRPLDAPELDPDDAERVAEDWVAARKDVGRRVPLLEEGTEFAELGVSPKDAEMLAGRRFTREEVAAVYGLANCPPSNEEERRQILVDVVRPLMRFLTETLDLSVLGEEYEADDHYFEFDLDPMLENDKLKALTSATGRPVLLTNEGRAAIDKPPVEGGDELVTPANVIVGENPKPSPGVMPIQDPNKPPQDGSHRTEEEPEAPSPVPASSNGSRAAPVDELDELERVLRVHFAHQANVAGRLDTPGQTRSLARRLDDLVPELDSWEAAAEVNAATEESRDLSDERAKAIAGVLAAEADQRRILALSERLRGAPAG